MAGINILKTDHTAESSPNASHSKLMYDTTQGWGYLDDAEAFHTFGTGAFEDRIWYDEIPATLYTAYPLVNINNILRRFAPKLSTDNTNAAFWFTNVNFMFINTTTNAVTNELKFADMTAMQTWVNTNVPNNGAGSFTESGHFLIYDVIDSEIPPITKLYGQNSLFGSFTAGNYKSHQGNAGNCGWPYAPGMFAALFNTVCNTFLTAADFSAYTARAAVWLAQNYTRYEKSLHYVSGSSTRIDYGASGSTNRYYYDKAGGVFNQINPATQATWTMTGVFYLTAQLGSSPGYSIHTRSGNNSHKQEIAHEMKQNHRGIVVYGFQQSGNSNNVGILIKPMGIDTVIVNYPDFTKYQLEILYKANGEAENLQYVNVISNVGDLSASGVGYDNNSGRMVLIKEDWMCFGDLGYQKKTGFGRTKYPDVCFRLRNKTTFKVSSLSRAYINTITKFDTGGIIPFASVIRTDKK